MTLTSIGFVFLILPFLLGVYYLCSNKIKPFLMIAFSLFFLFSLENVPIYLFLLIFIDLCSVFLIERKIINPFQKKATLIFCIIKDIGFILLFGISHWVNGFSKVSGVCCVVMIFCCYCMSDMLREKSRNVSSIEFFNYVIFFPKLFVGPFISFNDMKRNNKVFKTSLTSIASGIMRFTMGLAKHIIIANQLGILLATLSKHFFVENSILLGWLLALIAAMRIYFIVSGYGDIARGISQMFSLTLPKTTYYPFHSPSVRDYIFRFNLALESLVGNILFGKFERNIDFKKSYLVSAISVFLLCFVLAEEGLSLWWGIYMVIVLIPDYFLFRRISDKLPIISRIITFLITLPAFSFSVVTSTAHRFDIFKVMTTIKSAPILESNFAYLSISNVVLIIFSIFFCLSIMESVSRFLKKQSPTAWWVISVLSTVGILIFTVSFMLMRVV